MYIPAAIIQATPKNVLPDGISLNRKYPGIIDIIIREYSNKETTMEKQLCKQKIYKEKQLMQQHQKII